MRIRYRFGTTLLAVCALTLTSVLMQHSAGAQAVSSLPVAIYEGTCESDAIERVLDLEPIVPAASVTGATFAGSDEAIDVAVSITSLEVSFTDLMNAAPLAIIVASGTDANATELACGVIGGFVANGAVVFGIDDANDSGISGVGSIADLGSAVEITVILGEFPVGQAGAGEVAGGAAGATCVEVAAVAPHGPAVAGDADGDSVADIDEPAAGLDPSNADTDGDGLIDGLEAMLIGTDPVDPDSFAVDTDLDGLPDSLEAQSGFDSNSADTDFDGIPDGWEVFLGNDPLDPESPLDTGTDNSVDADQDGSTNRTEIEMGSDPANPDSDGDGVSDGAEVLAGTNPMAVSC